MARETKTIGQFRKTRRRGARTPHDVRKEVARLVLDEGYNNAAEIERKLRLDERFAGDQVPTSRTIQYLLKNLKPQDPSAPWTLATSDPDDSVLVLPVVAAVAERTQGRRGGISQLEADWIVRLRRAAPDLPLVWCSRLAWRYMVRVTNRLSTAELDEMLGFAPWQNEEAFNRYLRFVYVAHPDWVPRRETDYPASGIGESHQGTERYRLAYALYEAIDMRCELTGSSEFEFPPIAGGKPQEIGVPQVVDWPTDVRDDDE